MLGLFVFTDVVEHEDGAEDEGGRVGDAFARDVWGRAVDGFEHSTTYADVGPGGKAETADEARAEVAHDVAVEVLGDEDIKPLGTDDELHAAVIDDDLV